MNSNHFDPKLIYSHKLRRLKKNIESLEEAEAILEELPLKVVQTYWRRIATTELPKRTEKSSSSHKGHFKQCIKRTILSFLVCVM